MLNRLLSILNKQKLKEIINIILEILGITLSPTLLTIRYQILGLMKISLPLKNTIGTQRKELENLSLKLNLREILCYQTLNITMMLLHIQSTIQFQTLVLMKTLFLLKNISKTWRKNMVNGLLLKLNKKESLSYLTLNQPIQILVIQSTTQYQTLELIQTFWTLRPI